MATKLISELTADTDPNDADLLESERASDGASRKVTRGLLTGLRVSAIKTSAYTPAEAGEIVLCDPTGGGFSIGLPALAAVTNGRPIVVKNVSTSTNTITIDADGAETIDGSLTTTITTSRGVVWLMPTSGGWIVV